MGGRRLKRLSRFTKKNRNKNKAKKNILREYDLKTKKKIIELSSAIKKKHASLKLHHRLEEAQLEKHALPIVNPIKHLLNVKKEEISKKEPNEEAELKKELENNDDGSTTRKTAQKKIAENRVQFLGDDEVFSTSPTAENDSPDELSRSRATFENTMAENLANADEFWGDYHELPRRYILNMLTTKDNAYDTTYGVKYEPELDKWKLGNSVLTLKNHDKDLWIGRTRYNGTEGLYELLFKKDPINYSNEDLNNYASMLIQTSAHKIQFDPKLRNKGCASRKYMEIIKPALEKKHDIVRNRAYSATADLATSISTPKNKSGRGLLSNGKMLMKYENKPYHYVYFDDINEIVERLKLLINSSSAGNSSHQNEINSIIEELRELDVII